MTEEQLKIAVKQAMIEAFISLGVDANDPIEMQKDLQYIRQMRRGCESVKSIAVKSIITVTVPSMLYVIWLAIKQSIKG